MARIAEIVLNSGRQVKAGEAVSLQALFPGQLLRREFHPKQDIVTGDELAARFDCLEQFKTKAEAGVKAGDGSNLWIVLAWADQQRPWKASRDVNEGDKVEVVLDKP